MIVTAMKRKDGQFHQIVNCSLSSRNNYRYQAICLLIFLPSRALFMYWRGVTLEHEWVRRKDASCPLLILEFFNKKKNKSLCRSQQPTVLNKRFILVFVFWCLSFTCQVTCLFQTCWCKRPTVYSPLLCFLNAVI